jgi:citrate synthase
MPLLTGPLHGLANQEVLTWLNDVEKQLGRCLHSSTFQLNLSRF